MSSTIRYMDASGRREPRSGRRLRHFRRLAIAALLLASLALPLALPKAAPAHPLGNFTLNHLTYVEVSSNRVDLLYILDQAEIPTFREQQINFTRAQVLKRKLAQAQGMLILVVDGRRVALRPKPGAKISYPPGAAGLDTTRVELPFTAKVKDPRRVEVRDTTYGDLLGYVDMVARPGRGTAVRTDVSRADPTNGLRTYRGTALKDAPQDRVGRFTVRPGSGTLVAPGGPSATGGEDSGGDAFTKVFEDAASGEGLFLLLLLAAFGWGALHALSPGHGKAMVAAYLIGTRGTAKQAIALGGIVTVTHTIGVFALGLVTLLLAQYILPEDLYPWLNLVAGLLIVAVGLGVLRSRIRWGKEQRASALRAQATAHSHEHVLIDNGHGADHDHGHGSDHGHSHGPEDHHGHGDSHSHGHAHAHGHHHDHHFAPETTWKGLAGMGISAGLIPCPTALVVLLAAISQQQIALGLLLIVVFSLGLASTLTALGLVVVSAKRLASRVGSRFSFSSRVAAALPALSTLVILALGVALTAKAIPDVM
jgi:nickel/cobalt transporter (NicO) family protein